MKKITVLGICLMLVACGKYIPAPPEAAELEKAAPVKTADETLVSTSSNQVALDPESLALRLKCDTFVSIDNNDCSVVRMAKINDDFIVTNTNPTRGKTEQIFLKATELNDLIKPAKPDDELNFQLDPSDKHASEDLGELIKSEKLDVLSKRIKQMKENGFTISAGCSQVKLEATKENTRYLVSCLLTKDEEKAEATKKVSKKTNLVLATMSKANVSKGMMADTKLVYILSQEQMKTIRKQLLSEQD